MYLLESTTVDWLLAFTCVTVVDVAVGEHHGRLAVGVHGGVEPTIRKDGAVDEEPAESEGQDGSMDLRLPPPLFQRRGKYGQMSNEWYLKEKNEKRGQIGWGGDNMEKVK
jgi:hypothetical protein